MLPSYYELTMVDQKVINHMVGDKASSNCFLKVSKSLNVDIALQQSGNSNDGNTEGKFFSDPKALAKITGLDEKLISNFRYILLAINSEPPINIDNLNKLCKETGKRYIELYSWYFISPTVHELLVHGPEIGFRNLY